MTAIVGSSPPTVLQFFDNRGNPAAKGTVLTQVGGVNYATYQDAGGATPLPNPIPLNSRGEVSNASGVSCQLFLVSGVTYTFTLYDSAGNQLNQATSMQGMAGITNLSASTGSSLVGFIAAGAGAVARTAQSKMRDVVNVNDFGADPTGAVDATAAFTAAMAAVNAAGGGIVHANGIYSISNLSFGATVSVAIEGEKVSYAGDQDLGTGGTRLNCTTGTYAIRMPYGHLYGALINLDIVSNGALNSVPPCPVVTAGVEYGVVIETGMTLMRGVTVRGFQYGAGISNLGNGNVFELCNLTWNTKCGFFCTAGSAAAYAAMHPNLSVPAGLGKSTRITLRNCNMRRNGWGAILTDGGGVMDAPQIESNFFGGLYIASGTTIRGTPSWKFTNKPHLEANWAGYTAAVLAASTAYTITQNNLLQETAGAWPSWTISNVNANNDPGYQLYMDSEAAGVSAGPPQNIFEDAVLVPANPSAQKMGYLKSAYQTLFIRGSNADAGAGVDNFKLNAGTGGKYATSTGFADFAVTGTPASFGNRGYWWQTDGAGVGGIIWLAGGGSQYNTYTGTIVTGDMTVPGITDTISYATDGERVTLYFPAGFTGTSAAGAPGANFRIDGMPASLLPAVARQFICRTQDNSGSMAVALGQVETSGRITLFKDVNGGVFTAGGTKSLGTCSVTYIK